MVLFRRKNTGFSGWYTHECIEEYGDYIVLKDLVLIKQAESKRKRGYFMKKRRLAALALVSLMALTTGCSGGGKTETGTTGGEPKTEHQQGRRKQRQRQRQKQKPRIQEARSPSP